MSDATAWLQILDRVLLRLGQHPLSPNPAGILVRALVEETGVGHVELWLYDPATDALHRNTAAQRGVSLHQHDGSAPSNDAELLAGKALKRREPVTGESMHGVLAGEGAGLVRPLDLPAYAAVPLLLGDQPCGVIVLRQSAPFPTAVLAALPLLGRQAALLVEHARVVGQARVAQEGSTRQLDRLGALSRITHQLLAAEELDAVVRVVAESASPLCGATGAIIQLIDDEQPHLIVLASYREPQTFLRAVSRLSDR